MRSRIVVLMIVVSAGAVACTEGIERGAEALGSRSPTTPPAPSVSISVSPSASGTTSPSAEPGSPTGEPIFVEAPLLDDQILSPVVVRGVARTSSGSVLVRIVDATGMEVASMNVEVDCGAGCSGGFRVALAFFVESTQPGTVQVFEVGDGGTAKHLVEVPVTLVPGV
jgi:hypothetical protein